MKTERLWKPALLAVLAVGAAVWFLNRESASSPADASKFPEERVRTTRPDPATERSTKNEQARRTIRTDWQSLIAWLESDPPPTEAEILERLLATRVAWAEMDLQLLAEMIAALLATGEDAKTGAPFRVGPHGFLKSWPSLRVFLLDALAAADPEMAATIARNVLDSTNSADEFAVALRSLTRKGSGRAPDAELLANFTKMLGREDWSTSAGFAAAFDMPRLLGHPDAARSLLAWNGNPRLRDMALDEFAADHPAEILTALKDSPGVGEATRASLMARANPADPIQLQAVDAYLKQPDLGAGEAAVFLKSFPLRSATTGFRLYEKTPAPYDYATIVAGDRAALEQVDKWIADAGLTKYRAELTALKNRLVEWTEQTR